MTQTEALRLALEALECMAAEGWLLHGPEGMDKAQTQCVEAITAIKAALEAKDEPVGEVLNERGEVDYISYVPPVGTALYTTPPKQEAKDEPVPVAIVEVFGKDWRLDYMALPVGKHKLYAQQYTYTTPPQQEAKDEPVAWQYSDIVSDGGLDPRNTTPPQRTWVGLTEEEIEVIEVLRAPPVHPDFVDCDDWVEFARAIEAKLKEKNT